MGRIHIDEVLQQISDSAERQGRPFQLAFVRSSGERKGSIKIVAKARRGVRPGAKDVGPASKADGTARKRALHSDRGTLPLYDDETGQYITPLVSHIVEFNLQKVYH
jgi:hypothetical protein